MFLEKYSFGVGDRFGHQGRAQVAGLMQARLQGVAIVPVWNKSNREHSIIGTRPQDTRRAADAAVQAAGWKDAYYVDADHIQLGTVDAFVESSNFFTLDVAESIGQAAGADRIADFVGTFGKYTGSLKVEGIEGGLAVSREDRKSVV